VGNAVDICSYFYRIFLSIYTSSGGNYGNYASCTRACLKTTRFRFGNFNYTILYRTTGIQFEFPSKTHDKTKNWFWQTHDDGDQCTNWYVSVKAPGANVVLPSKIRSTDIVILLRRILYVSLYGRVADLIGANWKYRFNRPLMISGEKTYKCTIHVNCAG
jgi:hypothetical protein